MMPRVQKGSHRRESFSRLSVTTESEGSSLFGGGNCDANRKGQQVRTSELPLPDRIREILQRAVRGHGKNAGHRLPLRPSGLQGPGALAVTRSFARGMPGPRALSGARKHFFRLGRPSKDSRWRKAEGPPYDGPSGEKSSKADARMAKKPFYALSLKELTKRSQGVRTPRMVF